MENTAARRKQSVEPAPSHAASEQQSLHEDRLRIDALSTAIDRILSQAGPAYQFPRPPRLPGPKEISVFAPFRPDQVSGYRLTPSAITAPGGDVASFDYVRPVQGLVSIGAMNGWPGIGHADPLDPPTSGFGPLSNHATASFSFKTRFNRPAPNPSLPAGTGQRVSVTVCVTVGATNEPDPDIHLSLQPETEGRADVSANACAKLMLGSSPSVVPASGGQRREAVAVVSDCLYFLDASKNYLGDQTVSLWKKNFTLCGSIDLPITGDFDISADVIFTVYAYRALGSFNAEPFGLSGIGFLDNPTRLSAWAQDLTDRSIQITEISVGRTVVGFVPRA